VSKLPPSTAAREWIDLIAFVAVLTTGILLIILGHVTTGGLTTVCAALVGSMGRGSTSGVTFSVKWG
jgi:hypothetical protein